MKLTTRPRRRVAPGVGALDAFRVVHKVEHLDLALPHGLSFVGLVDGHGLDPRRRATLQMTDRVEQGGESGVVHGPTVAMPHANVHGARLQIRTVPNRQNGGGLLRRRGPSPLRSARPSVRTQVTVLLGPRRANARRPLSTHPVATTGSAARRRPGSARPPGA